MGVGSASWLLSNQFSSLLKPESGGAEPLASLQFISDAVFLASQCDGAYVLADIRTPGTKQLLAPPPRPDPTSSSSALWWTAVAAEQPSEDRLLRLASSGLMEMSDLRKVGRAFGRAQLIIPTRTIPLTDSITVSWAPMLDNCVAVSGENICVDCWISEFNVCENNTTLRNHIKSNVTCV